MFEERQCSSIPLEFEFCHCPEQGYAPIHAVMDSQNKHIKAFYWRLWFEDDAALPDIGLRDKFIGPEVIVDSSNIEQFCSVVGNQSVRNTDMKAPMDLPSSRVDR